MGRKSFVFYESWKNAIDQMSKEVQLEIYQAITEYAIAGKEIPLKPMAKIAFSFIRQDLDRDAKAYLEKCRKNQQNALKGGAPKGNKNARKTTQTTGRLKKQPEQPDNDNEYDNEDEYNYKYDYTSTTVDDEDTATDNSTQSPPAAQMPDPVINYSHIIDHFNQHTKGIFGRVRHPISQKRKDHIRARIREYGTEAFEEVIDKCTQSSFLKGDTGKFKATFDWIILPTNFEKILTGNYDDRQKTNNPAATGGSLTDW